MDISGIQLGDGSYQELDSFDKNMKKLTQIIRTTKRDHPDEFRDMQRHKGRARHRNVDEDRKTAAHGVTTDQRQQSNDQVQASQENFVDQNFMATGVSANVGGDKVVMKDDKNIILGSGVSQSRPIVAPTLAT